MLNARKLIAGQSFKSVAAVILKLRRQIDEAFPDQDCCFVCHETITVRWETPLPSSHTVSASAVSAASATASSSTASASSSAVAITAFMCQSCECVQYCSLECQQSDADEHSLHCQRLQRRYRHLMCHTLDHHHKTHKSVENFNVRRFRRVATAAVRRTVYFRTTLPSNIVDFDLSMSRSKGNVLASVLTLTLINKLYSRQPELAQAYMQEYRLLSTVSDYVRSTAPSSLAVVALCSKQDKWRVFLSYFMESATPLAMKTSTSATTLTSSAPATTDTSSGCKPAVRDDIIEPDPFNLACALCGNTDSIECIICGQAGVCPSCGHPELMCAVYVTDLLAAMDRITINDTDVPTVNDY
jgi:hypothetical protein